MIVLIENNIFYFDLNRYIDFILVDEFENQLTYEEDLIFDQQEFEKNIIRKIKYFFKNEETNVFLKSIEFKFIEIGAEVKVEYSKFNLNQVITKEVSLHEKNQTVNYYMPIKHLDEFDS